MDLLAEDHRGSAFVVTGLTGCRSRSFLWTASDRPWFLFSSRSQFSHRSLLSSGSRFCKKCACGVTSRPFVDTLCSTDTTLQSYIQMSFALAIIFFLSTFRVLFVPRSSGLNIHFGQHLAYMDLVIERCFQRVRDHVDRMHSCLRTATSPDAVGSAQASADVNHFLGLCTWIAQSPPPLELLGIRISFGLFFRAG